jgi:hypothetical protein
MPTDITKKYEARHLANTTKYQKQVLTAYNNAIDKIFKKAGYIRIKGSVFKLSDYPALNNLVNKTLLEFHSEVTLTIVNGIKGEWELAAEKNVDIISKAYAGRNFSDAVNKIIYDQHLDALETFTNLKYNGLNLSDRVWKYTNQFQSEIEQGLYTGISTGRSAASMASDQKQYLQQPDKLFRRVRDAAGELVLSKSAQAYHPGKGVYRSSYKNAFRMTRSIVNDSYRKSDQTRWDAIPFVLGYEVKLSNNHPKHDICDYLAGTYPKTFKWLKWHIQCICYAIPKLASPAEFDEYENAVLAGTDNKFQFTSEVKDIPSHFTEYVKANSDRFKNWNVKPDWLTDNTIKF